MAKLKEYIASFETTYDEVKKESRIWLWGLRPANDNINEDIITGTSINEFIQAIQDIPFKMPIIYFHDFNFESCFIVNALMDYGYQYKNKSVSKLQMGEFCVNSTLQGDIYGINVCFENKRIRFKASNKLFNQKREDLAKSYNLPVPQPISDEPREKGYIPTLQEIKHLEDNLFVISYILYNFRQQGYKKYTAASAAMYEFITQSFPRKDGKEKFKTSYNMFLERHKLTEQEDTDIRQSYFGGFCYINPEKKNKTIGPGRVYDNNSMFSSRMYYQEMPYGAPIHGTGKPFISDKYKLFVAKVKLNCRLCEGGIPMIPNKHDISSHYKLQDYIEDTFGETIILWLTSVDLQLVFENYDVFEIEFIEYYSFKSKPGGWFRPYIEHFYVMKQEARKAGDEVKAQFAKMFLNSLYGKFGTNPTVFRTAPQKVADGSIRYKISEITTQPTVYVALSTFITAYARQEIIRGIKANADRFLYCDTDSLHLEGEEPANGIEIDPYKLGAWKLESTFTRAKFLGLKQYIEEEPDGTLLVKVAGLHSSGIPYVTFDNFRYGAQYPTLMSQSTNKGKRFIQSIFTLKER